MGVCSMYVHSCYIMYVRVLYFVSGEPGSKDIWKLEFNIVEIYISYSFLICYILYELYILLNVCNNVCIICFGMGLHNYTWNDSR